MPTNNIEPDDMLNSLQAISSVAFTRFNSAHLTPGCLVCFFEGPQDKFYYDHRIKSICGEYIEIVCEGKHNVKEIYKWIHNAEKTKYRLSYFIDHDFDAPIVNVDFFETDGYAIENYYCSRSAFENVLRYYIGINPINDLEDYKRATDFYDQQMNDFHNITKLFNNYYAAIKKEEQTAPYPQYKIECGNSFPTYLATITIEEKVPKEDYTLEKLNERFQTNIQMEDIDAQESIIGTKPFSHYRGKYELSMVKMIVNKLISQTTNSSKVKKTNRVIRRTVPPLKVKACIDEGLYMQILSDYADTPDHLNDYLQQFS